jgi:hypothetical protein
MTTQGDLKRIIRERQRKSGESYTDARAQVMRERATLLGDSDEKAIAMQPSRLDAAVLKLNRQSAPSRLLGEVDEITLRSRDVWQIVAAHLAMLAIGDPPIGIGKLGLSPLPLRDGGLMDLHSDEEPFAKGDPDARGWRKLTARPRPDFIMHPIAWGHE